MVYYSLFAIIAIIGFCEQFAKYHRKGITIKVFFSIVIFTIFLLSSLRWERGSDWDSFLSFFNNPWTNVDTHYEWGFTTINRLFRKITDNYSLFLAFQTGLFLIFSIKFFYKISNYYPDEKPFFFSLLLYQFAGNFSGIFTTRSQIAGILCALALCYIREKQLLKFIIYILLATLFHTSSLAVLVAYPIYHIRIKDKVVYLLFIMLGFLGTIFPKLIMNIIVAVAKLQRYGAYLYLDKEARISGGLVKWGFLLALALWTSVKMKNEWTRGYARIIAIGLVIYLWSSFYGSVFNRVSGLFFYGAFFIIPEFFHCFKGKRKLIAYFFYIGWCFISFYSLFNGNYHPLYEPYKSIFDSFSVITSVPE